MLRSTFSACDPLRRIYQVRSASLSSAEKKYLRRDFLDKIFFDGRIFCAVSRHLPRGGGGKGRQDENIVMEPVKQPDGDALVTFTMMLRTIKKKNKNKKSPQ